MFLYLYIVLVNSWYFLSEFYPELTWIPVLFHPASTVFHVHYLANPPNVTLLAVEHKKLGIRHNLLGVNM
jgi:hypothetical protein